LEAFLPKFLFIRREDVLTKTCEFPFWAVVLLNVLSSFLRQVGFVDKGNVNETKGIIH